MKAATIQTIKEELTNLPPATVLEICLRLAKYKKENKELLSYILFEAQDEHAFIRTVKQEMDDSFDEISSHNPYFVKKALRKILRTLTKYSKHTGSKQAELEWLIHFCKNIKDQNIPYKRTPVLQNIYDRQVKKIYSLIDSLHDDLQYDYRKDLLLL